MHLPDLSRAGIICNLPLTIQRIESMEKGMKILFASLILSSCLCSLAFGQGAMSELASVRISYETLSDRTIDGTNTEIGLDQWEVRAPFFYKESGDWKIAAGIRYQSTDFEVSDATLLNEDRLHSLDLAIFLSKRSSDHLDWLFLFNPNLAGDFENIGGDAMNYLTLAGVKWKKSESFQWIFGAVYTTGIGDDLFVPAIGFIWEPSEVSSFTFAGPIIRYSYEFSELLSLNLGGQFTGNRWNTEATYGGNLEQRDFRFRAYRLFANLQWNLNEHHSVFAGLGYDFAGELEIESTALNSDRDIEDGGVFEIGYKYGF